MSIRIGDAVFLRSGLPAAVKDRDPATGQLVLQSEPNAVREQMRHGYINGMSQETRSSLYDILDRIKEKTEDPRERVAEMQLKLNELDQDPHNRDLSRYLRAEMLHLMNTFDIKPREFKLEEFNVR